MTNNIVDHLFKHQYGKMVSVLTRIFGLSNIEIIEDAVQDTFLKATLSWKNKLPDNPEGWIVAAAKNRVVDLIRKIKTDGEREARLTQSTSALAIDQLFLDKEIEDSQLRMIFVACHPTLDPRDQISFALKTISGFSQKEIASALLLKEETVKKRLSRARKSISESEIMFEIPQGNDLLLRLDRVLEVIYVIFNEGFHSGKKEQLIREELCGEAMRLCKLVLAHKYANTPKAYALFALMCFQAARLPSKTNDDNEVISLGEQDRSKWYKPLIQLGFRAIDRAITENVLTPFHCEAFIAAEHVRAKSFKETDWDSILKWYKELNSLEPSYYTQLNMAVVHLQRKNYHEAKGLLDNINPKVLEQRSYLYFGTYAEYYIHTKDFHSASKQLEIAISKVTNDLELKYLTQKKNKILAKLK